MRIVFFEAKDVNNSVEWGWRWRGGGGGWTEGGPVVVMSRRHLLFLFLFTVLVL